MFGTRPEAIKLAPLASAPIFSRAASFTAFTALLADEMGAAAVDYLRVAGHLVFAYFWARMAKVALAKQGSGDPFYTAKLATARFYFARLLPETAMLSAFAAPRVSRKPYRFASVPNGGREWSGRPVRMAAGRS